MDPTQPEIQYSTVEQKLAELEMGKKKFLKIYHIVRFVVLIVFLYGFSMFIYGRFFRREPPQPVKPSGTVPAEVITPKAVTEEIYLSDLLKMSFEYNNDAQVEETTASLDPPIFKTTVLYSADENDRKDEMPKKFLEGAIVNGYIFKVTRFETTMKNINGIAATKMESLRQICGPEAQYTGPYANTIDSINSLTLEIKNCSGDYKVSFSPRFYSYYEIDQISKGDFGYRERYNRTMDEMLGSFKFYTENPPPYRATELYELKKYGLSFEHPHFVSGCCDIPGPINANGENITKHIVLVDKNTMVDNSNFDGIGIFTVAANDYEAYVEKQKNLQKDEYIVAKGFAPTTEVINLTVGGREAMRLKGFSWKGNELVIVNTLGAVRGEKYILVISIKNISGEKFEKKLTDILGSFKFL